MRCSAAVYRHRREQLDAAHGGLAASSAEKRSDAGESLESRLPGFDRELWRWWASA